MKPKRIRRKKNQEMFEYGMDFGILCAVDVLIKAGTDKKRSAVVHVLNTIAERGSSVDEMVEQMDWATEKHNHQT